MANNRCVYQQQMTVSIPKQDLLDFVVYNDALSKKDLKVCLLLFTQLDGWKEPKRQTDNSDPMNFKKLDVESIATELNMKVKDVIKSLHTLEDEGVLERGSNTVVHKGYRFTF